MTETLPDKPAERKTFLAETREEWRAWLEKNHKKESKIYLVLYKKHTGKPILGHLDAMHEAICFGWIDTTANRVDDEKWSICFVRRGPNARWSLNTLKYGKQLFAERKMSPAGIKAYKHGLKKGAFDRDREESYVFPEDLKSALSKNKTAKKNFDNFPQSSRKTYLRWLYTAKLPETRKKRIKIIVQNAEENKKSPFV